MKQCIAMIICCIFFVGTPVHGESLGDAKSLSYLQRAYFALEQALFYTQKSRATKTLSNFDYSRLLGDIELIEKDLQAYLYPRSEKITGDYVPFKIEGDYFLEDIINTK